MYITYWPDVVVIDTTADPVVVGETYLHLRSVSDPAGRQTPIVLLGAEQAWDDAPSVYYLPVGLHYGELLDQLFDLLRTAHYNLNSAAVAFAN